MSFTVSLIPPNRVTFSDVVEIYDIGSFSDRASEMHRPLAVDEKIALFADVCENKNGSLNTLKEEYMRDMQRRQEGASLLLFNFFEYLKENQPCDFFPLQSFLRSICNFDFLKQNFQMAIDLNYIELASEILDNIPEYKWEVPTLIILVDVLDRMIVMGEIEELEMENGADYLSNLYNLKDKLEKLIEKKQCSAERIYSLPRKRTRRSSATAESPAILKFPDTGKNISFKLV